MKIRLAKKIVTRTANGEYKGRQSTINRSIFLMQRRVGRDFSKTMRKIGARILSKQTPYEFLQDVYHICRANWR